MKNKAKQRIIFTLLAMILAFAAMFSLAACAPSVDGPYEVIMNYSNGSSNETDLTKIIERLRMQVVDVYTKLSDGSSAGSGVIVSSNDNQSFIITNHHVVGDGYEFEVDVMSISLSGAEKLTTYKADFIGGSPKDDIAVLRIDAGGLPAATWSESDKVKVGTEVVAIGNPLGVLGGTVTRGIISATARSVYVESVGVMTLMQTDAAINSGNSGGGLFTTEGNLIGIVNSGVNDAEGIGFAIPEKQAVAVATELISTYDGNGNYGYVSTRTKVGINLNYRTVYTTSTRTTLTEIIYISSIESGSDGASSGINGNYAVNSIEHNGITYSYDKSIYFTMQSFCYNMQLVLDSIKAGTKVTLNLEKLSSTNGTYRYYLSGVTSSVTITATQFIYSPPIV